VVRKLSVFKTLVKHTGLGSGGTGVSVKQLMDDSENQVKKYLSRTEELYQRHPEMIGLESFLRQMKTIFYHVKERIGQPFDSEIMTKLSLAMTKLMIKLLYFEYKIAHEAKSMKRHLQEDVLTNIEMSDKMKSEVGLHAFLEHVSKMEGISAGKQDKDATPSTARSVEKGLGISHPGF